MHIEINLVDIDLFKFNNGNTRAMSNLFKVNNIDINDRYQNDVNDVVDDLYH